MQNKNLNNEENFDNNNEEEFIDISSSGSGFNITNNNDDKISEDEKTDINEISANIKNNNENNEVSYKPVNNIEIVEDFQNLNAESDSSNKKNRYKEAGKKNFFSKHKIPIIITSAVVVLIAAVGTVLWQLASNGIIPNPFEETVGPIVNEEGEFTFLPGVQISGVDISGKTYDEAKKLLEDNKSKFIKDFNITIEANEKSYEFTPEEFTYTYNIEEVLNQAKKYCEDAHEGEIDVTEPTTDKQGHYNDMYTITATVVDDSIEAVAIKIADETDIDAKNARVSKFTPFAKDKFEYEDGAIGYKTDKKDLSAAIKTFITSGKETGVISAKVDVIEPKITKEMVKKNIVPLSCFRTTSVNSENGTSNMGKALEACNGSVIEPGETWSFNGCTGDSNLESNGYLPAGVILDGSMGEGIGGGICQASTTIYNAALFANMEVVERSMHYWASTYVPAGFDATIDYPAIDLKLKNTTDYQMFMECTLNGRELYCAIYGYQDPSYDDIATYSENYNIISGESYDTVSYRIFYKDGKEVSREELPSSHYSLTEGHYVQYSDDGTHRQKPEGAKTQKSNKAKNDSSQVPEEDTDDDDGDVSINQPVDNDVNNNTSSAKSTASTSSSSSNTSDNNKPASSNSNSSNPVQTTQPESATSPATEANEGSESGED